VKDVYDDPRGNQRENGGGPPRSKLVVVGSEIGSESKMEIRPVDQPPPMNFMTHFGNFTLDETDYPVMRHRIL